MKTRRVVAVSLLLNLALAGWLAVRVGRTPDGAVGEERSAIRAAGASPTSVITPSASNPAPAITFVTNRFQWPQIETNDLVQLAQNLRALGCPEKTVRELVSARARRQLAGLRNRAESRLPFWTAGLRRAQAKAEANRDRAAAAAKIHATVEQALGPGVFDEDAKTRHDFVEQAVMRFVCGPMSEEAFAGVQAAFARQQASEDEIQLRADRILLPADEAAIAQTKQRLQTELSALLSPAVREEFTARFGMMSFADEICFAATDLTLAEVRQIGLRRGRFLVSGMSGSMDRMELSDGQEEQFQRELRQWLGESRYAAFQRAADRDFRTLFELGQANQLAASAAASAFELRQSTAQEVTRLLADKSLAETEREQRLLAVQAKAQEALLKVLGATALQQYLRNGGAWVTNVTKL